MDNDTGKNLAVFAGKAVIVGIVVCTAILVLWPSVSLYEKCKVETRMRAHGCIINTSW